MRRGKVLAMEIESHLKRVEAKVRGVKSELMEEDEVVIQGRLGRGCGKNDGMFPFLNQQE